MILSDPANIGILQILKKKKALTAKGTETRVDNENMKTIPGGLPAIVPTELYERAQAKLSTNQVEKSRPHKHPEDFLLKGHIVCKTCNYKMVGRYMTSRYGKEYPYYSCTKYRNKYDACPDLTIIRTDMVNQLVWENCCRVFERIELVRDAIEQNIERAVQTLLEDTRGKQLIMQLEQELAQTRVERSKHDEGSYLYGLITQDIKTKEEQLKRAVEDYDDSRDFASLADHYRSSILGFFTFLTVMKGKYHEATFQEKRNLKLKRPHVSLEQYDDEWFTVNRIVTAKIANYQPIHRAIRVGEITTHTKDVLGFP